MDLVSLLAFCLYHKPIENLRIMHTKDLRFLHVAVWYESIFCIEEWHGGKYAILCKWENLRAVSVYFWLYWYFIKFSNQIYKILVSVTGCVISNNSHYNIVDKMPITIQLE